MIEQKKRNEYSSYVDERNKPVLEELEVLVDKYNKIYEESKNQVMFNETAVELQRKKQDINDQLNDVKNKLLPKTIVDCLEYYKNK